MIRRSLRLAGIPLAAALLSLAGALPTAAAGPSPSPSPTPKPSVTPSLSPSPSPKSQPSASPSALPAPKVPTPAPAAPPATPKVAATAPSPASTPPPLGPSASDQTLVREVKRRLGDTIARSLAAQDQLAAALAQNAQQQEDLKAQIERSRAESDQVQAQIKAGESQIAATRKRIADERVAITELARVEYQQPDSTLVRLLRSGNAKDWVVGAADLAAAAHRGQELRSSLEQDLARLDLEQSARQSDLQRLTALQAEQVTNLGTMETLGQKQAEAGKQLVAEIAATRAELRKVDQQQTALADRISQALDAEFSRITGLSNQQAWRQVDLTLQSNPVVQTGLSVGHSTSSQFIWPMPKGPVSQGFGPSQLVFEPAFNGFAHFHTGIDIAGPENEPVLAADDGQVVLAATGASGYGNYVVLAHGQGLTTLYGHLNQILVKPGDRVSQRTAIGLEGSTGNSTGPHVHFEVRLNGTPVNPATYLPSGPPSSSRA